MASFTDSVKIVIDVVTDKAASSLKSVKSDIDNAEGGFGKLKAAGGGAFDLLKQNGPMALAGVGTAIGAFALSSIGEFQDLALSAKNFSAAAGTSVEDASRWIEVAGDLGVNTDAVQGAMGRLNREADSGKLAQYGITAENANDRLTQTLQYLASIPDEGKRSAATFDLLGKGGAALAPLIANVGSLKDRLAEVSDQKVISDEEADKARQYADAMDALSDRFGDFKLAIGGSLIGAMANFGTAADNIITKVQELKDALPLADAFGNFDLLNPLSQLDNLSDGLSRATDFSAGWQEQLKGVGSALTGNIPIIGGWADSLFGADQVTDGAADAQTQLANELENAKIKMQEETTAAADATAALQAHMDATLASFNSQLQFNDSVSAASTKVADYTAKLVISSDTNTMTKATLDATRVSQDDAAQAALRQASAAVQVATDLATANGETLTAAERNAILSQNLQGVANTLAPGNPLRVQLEGYISRLNEVPDSVTTDVKLNTRDADALLADWESRPRSLTYTVKTITSRVDPGVAGLEPRASGGPVEAGQPYVVGEKRPELFVPNQDGMILPKVPTVSGAALSGSPITVNINGALGSPQELSKVMVDDLTWLIRTRA